MDLSASPSTAERLRGIFLLGALQLNREQTIPVLTNLLSDPDVLVSDAALTALAEFPGPDITSFFAGRLSSAKDNKSVRAAAYGLHSDPEQTTQALIEAYETTHQRDVLIAVLAALEFKQILQVMESASTRTWLYESKRPEFDRTYIWIDQRLPSINEQTLWNTVRSNIHAGRLPSVRNEILRLEEARLQK